MDAGLHVLVEQLEAEVVVELPRQDVVGNALEQRALGELTEQQRRKTPSPLHGRIIGWGTEGVGFATDQKKRGIRAWLA